MTPARTVIAVAIILVAGAVARPSASGPMGLYGIVEKVVFEPNETAPERIQVWGAFAYVEGGSATGLQTSAAKRGYLYFRLPTTDASKTPAAKREWADLKAVAGTGQAVAFGRWGYIGGFGALQPDANHSARNHLRGRACGGATTDLRVRPESETPASPAAINPTWGSSGSPRRPTARSSNAPRCAEEVAAGRRLQRIDYHGRAPPAPGPQL
jgi:hypothetical protein